MVIPKLPKLEPWFDSIARSISTNAG